MNEAPPILHKLDHIDVGNANLTQLSPLMLAQIAQEVRNSRERDADTITALRDRLATIEGNQQKQLLLATRNSPVSIDLDQKHHFINSDGRMFDLVDPQGISDYIGTYVTSLDSTIEEIMKVAAHSCLDGSPAMPLSRQTIDQVRSYLVDILTKVTIEGKMLPLLDAPLPAGLRRKNRASIVRHILCLRSPDCPDSSLIGSSSRLDLIARMFGFNINKLDAMDPDIKHAIALNWLDPTNDATNSQLESMAEQIGKDSWKLTISNPKRKVTKTGIPGWFSFKSAFYVRRCELALRKLLTPELVIEAMENRIGANKLVAQNKRIVAWTQTKDLTFGFSVERFITLLVGTILEALLSPALHTVDIVQPHNPITYDDHRIILDIASNSLRNTREMLKLQQPLTDTMLRCAADLKAQGLPVRGSLVINTTDWLVDCISNQQPWTQKCLDTFKSLCDTNILTKPSTWWEGTRRQAGHSMGKNKLQEMHFADAYLNTLDPILHVPVVKYGNILDSPFKSDQSAPVNEQSENAVKASSSRFEIRKPQHLIKDRDSASAKKWWPKYLAAIKSSVPASLDINCKCGGKSDCMNCFALKLIADLNNVAHVAYGLKGFRPMSGSFSAKASAPRTYALRGRAKISIPLTPKIENRNLWKCVLYPAEDTERSTFHTCNNIMYTL